MRRQPLHHRAFFLAPTAVGLLLATIGCGFLPGSDPTLSCITLDPSASTETTKMDCTDLDKTDPGPYVPTAFMIPTAVPRAPFRLVYQGGSPTSAMFILLPDQPDEWEGEIEIDLELNETQEISGYRFHLVALTDGDSVRLAVTDPHGNRLGY